MNSSDSSASSMVYDHTAAKNIGDVLTKKYPDHLWAVTVNQGVAFIHNMALSGQWGFTIKLEDIDNDYKAIMLAGGEILERYKVHRGRMNEDEMMNLERDFAFRPKGELL